MNTATPHRSKSFVGFSVAQLIILAALEAVMCFVLGAGVALVSQRETIPVQLYKQDVSFKTIIGKWNKLRKPTPTPTFGPTATPMIRIDMLGTPRVVPTMPPAIVIDLKCDFKYPETVEFFEDGTYTGASDFMKIIDWNGGEFSILQDSRIKMATKGDGLSVYRFSIEADVITFSDEQGCQFQYQRMR